MGMLNEMAGANINKPVIDVRHATLQRYGDSLFKVECPTCKDGVLSVARDFETLQLKEFDCCLLCGQQYRYLDINEMRQGRLRLQTNN